MTAARQAAERKRADTREHPKEPERATILEHPGSRERATTDEHSKNTERASIPEHPGSRERAAHTEHTVARERAEKNEYPGAVERGETESDLPYRPVSPLRWLADTYEQTQRLRIQLSNRIAAVDREDDAGPPPSSAVTSLDLISKAERALITDMKDALAGHPAMPWLGAVKGIGPVLATKLLAQIDIERAPTISALWRFAGYAVIDGQRERMVKGGGKIHYCVRLKTACYLVTSGFIKLGDRSPYRAVYDAGRAYYLTARPDWTKGHQHLAAMRKTSKLFLSHLHTTWRTASGLPVREPYAMEYLDHTSWLDPWQFAETGA